MERKPCYFIGDAYDELKDFPTRAVKDMGFALHQAQLGGKSFFAKPLKGFKGAGVVEVHQSFEGNAYRLIYTVRYPNAVYVLHAFQKKSKSGIKTPKRSKALIESRLKEAADHAKTLAKQSG